MKKGVLVIAVLFLAVFAADIGAVAPQSADKPQSSIVHRQSPLVSRVDAVTIPQMLSYQGRLTDTLGQPVPNGDYSVAFRLYTAPSGGSPFWSETQDVTTRDGL